MLINLKNYTKYIVPFIILILANVLYNRYKDKQHREENLDDYSMIQKYLLTDHSLDNYEEDKNNGNKKQQKPILWVHMNYEYNSRSWASFGSRSSKELNQPYLYLTVRSIIRCCEKSFHICLIDDESFSKLLPTWSVDMNTLANPVLTYMRQLGLTKILYKYGGIIVPPSFLCMQNLINMYNVGTRDNKMFVGEMVNPSVSSTINLFSPNIKFMGANKETPMVKELIDYMYTTISNDYTSQNEFLGEFNKWINERVEKKKINLVEGKLIGTKTLDDEPIGIEMLMSNNYINIYPKTYGIYIPEDDILKRHKYEWFARLSPKQILESNSIICKYILLASKPIVKGTVIESAVDLHNKYDAVAYWQVPSGSDSSFGLWGLKPNYLGNHVRHSNIQRELVQ